MTGVLIRGTLRHSHTQREDHMRTQGEGSHGQNKEMLQRKPALPAP